MKKINQAIIAAITNGDSMQVTMPLESKHSSSLKVDIKFIDDLFVGTVYFNGSYDEAAQVLQMSLEKAPISSLTVVKSYKTATLTADVNLYRNTKRALIDISFRSSKVKHLKKLVNMLRDLKS